MSHGRRLGARIALGAVLSCAANTAAAEGVVDRLRVRVGAGLASMVSADQVESLGYDSLGVSADVQLGYAVWPWLQAHAAMNGATFPSAELAGGLLAPTAGVGVNTDGDGMRLYLHLDGGVGFTGRLERPFLRAAGGVDIRVTDALTLGPAVGYDQVFQHDTPTASTDARFVWVGLSLTLQPASSKPDPAPPPRPAPPSPPSRVEVRVLRSPATVFTEPSQELIELMDRALPREEVELHLLAPVLFRFDSDELEPIGVAMLHEVAGELGRRPELELVEIQGYADSRGTPEYNIELSQRRARRVFDWLVEHGVEAERLRVAALGASVPVEPGDADAAHEQNRRVVFRVLRLRKDAQPEPAAEPAKDAQPEPAAEPAKDAQPEPAMEQERLP